MRLINTETGEFFNCVDLKTTPPYAILSHTWDKDGEQTYQEVIKIQEKYGLHPPRKEVTFLNPRSDEPGTVQDVLTPPEIDTLSHSTPLISPTSPRVFLISLGILGILPLWWILAFIIISGWVSRIPDQATSSQPESHTDIQTHSPTPPTIRPSIWDSNSGLSEKVRKACEFARSDGHLYIWVDSSCIDKTSSSELSEAINSMYNWYSEAQVCYAFLADVPSDEDGGLASMEFRLSRWFRRCWTLQELIAPHVVVFLSQDWKDIGTKDSLSEVIYEITSIDRKILTHERALSDESVANRMGWASNREATRIEDEAYSLLGLFGIMMPTLYGEGQHAFRRLQEEILQRIPDQSIFAWGHRYIPFPLEPCEIRLSMTDTKTLLAPSPSSFETPYSYGITMAGNSIGSLGLPVQGYTHTPYGIRTQLRLLPVQDFKPPLKLDISDDESDTGTWYIALLGCQQMRDPNRLLSRLCYLRNGSPDVELLFLPIETSMAYSPSIFTISLEDLARSRNQLETRTVYLPHLKPSVTALRRQVMGQHNTLNLTFPKRAQADLLQMRGYTVSNVQGPTKDDCNSFSFSLVHASFNRVHIHYRHLAHPPSKSVAIQASVWVLSSDKDTLNADAAMPRSPPYTSVAWYDTEPWNITLPARSLDLIADSGEQVTLKMRLSLMALSRYKVSVDVVPTSTVPADGAASLQACDYLRDQVRLYDLHETFNLILTGSVRRILEMKGYSPHLALDPRLGGLRTHSLTLSRNTDSFVIVVKFFCALFNTSQVQSLLVVARITLESSIPNDEMLQDGPHVVVWRDRNFRLIGSGEDSWTNTLENRKVVLTTPTGQLLMLHLGFDIAWQSEYHLRVDVEPEPGHSTQTSLYPRPWRPRSVWAMIWANPTLALAHRNINLILPGYIRRALQAQKYDVHLERSDRGGQSGDSILHILTLSHITTGVTIAVEYSHHLTVITRCRKRQGNSNSDHHDDDDDYAFILAGPHPDPDLSTPADKIQWKRCQQELTFRVSARVLPFGGDTGNRAAVQNDLTTATVDWNAKYSYGHWSGKELAGWRRHLSNKDIILMLPTGHQLVLRLGFYYVWDGDYCLMVQVNPQTPLSRTQSLHEEPVMLDIDDELDKAGMEYIPRR